ncbi:MAG: AAA family ATPase [Phycisphaerales bacterium JB050]
MNESANHNDNIHAQAPHIEQAQQPIFAEDLPAPTPNPLLLVHRLMRGRYLLACILAALLAPIGAIGGYVAMPGKYVSVSQIQVPASLDPVLYRVQENESIGQSGYERVVGNEVEQMLRPERMRQAASLLAQYVNLYNEGLSLPQPDYTPEGREWRIDEAREAAEQLIRFAADETTYRALEEDWALRSASNASAKPSSLIEAVAPTRLLSPVGATMPTREEIATTNLRDLVIDPRTARRVLADFADVFQNTTQPRPPRGTEPRIEWDAGPGATERLEKMIRITPPRKSELIRIEAETDDPRLAAIASNAVLVTHRTTSRYADVGKRLRELRAREAELDTALRTYRRDVLALRLGFAVSATTPSARTESGEVPIAQDPRYIDRMSPGLRETKAGVRPAGLQRIRTSIPPDELLAEGYSVLEILRQELAAYERRITDLELATALNSGTDDEALEKADPRLRELREHQRQLELQVEDRKQRFGPNHRSVTQLESELAIATTRVQERIEELRQQIENARSPEKGNEQTPEDLRAELENLIQRREEKRNDIALVDAWLDIIPDSLLDLTEREAELARTVRLLDEVRNERTRLEVEMVNLEQGRFQYYAAQVPQKPNSDKRLPLAAAGFMAGGGFAFALIAGIGLIDRRYRYIEDVESNQKLPPVIGVLPMLSEKANDSEQSEVASLTVHHIRNMLLLDGRSSAASNGTSSARTIAITSAGPGDGKTSVVVALGMSFAQAGYRTLVIDADLVGRGLSSHFDVRASEGLSEALSFDPDTPVTQEPTPTAVSGLSVLSAGCDEDFRPEHMARERFSEVINHYRAKYDVVLIDSGPLLGSLEAGLATRCADRILLVVSRGSDQRSVSAVVKRFRDGGLRHVSLVFNKARPDDIEQSVSYISMRSQSIRAADQSGPGRRTVALARTLVGTPNKPNTTAEPEGAAR